MDFIAEAKKMESEVYALWDSTDDWKPSKQYDDFKLECKQSPHFEGQVYRAKVALNGPYDECFKYINVVAGSPRYDWDNDVNKLETKKQVDSETQILWTLSNSLAMGLISPRDLIQLIQVKKTDTFHQFLGKSIEIDEYPPQDKYVRAIAYPWGCRVEKDPIDHSKCIMTLMGQVDLRGRLPKSLVESSLPSLNVSMYKSYLAHLKKVGVVKK